MEGIANKPETGLLCSPRQSEIKAKVMERKRSFPAEERDRKSWKKWYTTE
jgi:hypothetical protein